MKTNMVRQNVMKELENYLDESIDLAQRDEIEKLQQLLYDGIDPDIVSKKLKRIEATLNAEKAKIALAELVILLVLQYLKDGKVFI